MTLQRADVKVYRFGLGVSLLVLGSNGCTGNAGDIGMVNADDGGSGTAAAPVEPTTGSSGASNDDAPSTSGSGATGLPDDDDDDDDDDDAQESGDSGTTDGGNSFLVPTGGDCFDGLPPGVLGHCSLCDPWTQDCPRGDKCVPWANDGGDEYNATRCIELDPEAAAPGESCTMLGGPFSGVDDCDFDSLCLDVDPETLEGICVLRCGGSEDAPECPDGTACLIDEEGFLAVCVPS